MTAIDGSYSLTVAVGASVWGVVGVLIPWGGRLVLPFFIIIIILCVCVCVLTTAVLIIDLCNCYSYCCFICFFCIVGKILKRKKKIVLKKRKPKKGVGTPQMVKFYYEELIVIRWNDFLKKKVN